MKTPSNELFQLIKSLDSTEKRYFKIYASKNSENGEVANYVKLFDIIDNQENYDEGEVKKKLGNNLFTKNFKKSKYYLYNSVLTALELNHSSSSVDGDIQRLTTQADILLNKKLFSSAKKIIAKAELLALKNEKYPQLLTVLACKRDILRAEMNLKQNLTKILVESFENDYGFIDIYKNSLEYKKIFYKASVPFLGKHPVYRSKHPKQELKRLLQHPLLSNESKAQSYSAKRFYFYSLISIHRILGDFEKNYSIMKRFLSYMEKSPKLLKTYTYDYFEATVRSMVYQSMLYKFNEVEILCGKFFSMYENLPAKERTKKMQALINKAHIVLLQCYINNKEYNKAKNKIAEVQKIKNPESSIDKDSLVSFYLICASFKLTMKEFKQALFWLNKFFSFEEKEVRRDLRQDAQIISILVHYELGNMDYLPYLIKSTIAIFKKSNTVLQTDWAIVNFFKKQSALTKIEPSAFVSLKNEIESILKKSSKENILYSIDYLSWINSKTKR